MDNRTLLVTEIERSAIHDGPGLRTVVFLQGCPLRCFWCCNPETRPAKPVLLHDHKKCVGCGACITCCPNAAISLSGGKAVVDRSLCRGCGNCVDICPVGANALSGREMPLADILNLVERDRAYYEFTGGGMTLSGGEPLMQPAAVALLKMAAERGISSWLETTAFVPKAVLEEAARYADGFYVDYKHPDADALRKATAAEIAVVEDNIRFLIEKGANVTLRTPVIPGFNDDREILLRCIAFSASLGLKKHVLLPYHNLGRGKYEKLDLDYPMESAANMLAAELEDMSAIGSDMGLEIQIGG